MNKKRTSLLDNGLIWFGAAVSIAEIITGTYIAPLGFSSGLLAILIGHIIGCAVLFCAGLIGATTGKSAMQTAKMSFGSRGAILFAILNIVQLVGWTSIMIFDGALAANNIYDIGNWLWCILIGVLIILWIVIGIKNISKINIVAVGALFILTVILSVIVLGNHSTLNISSETITFGAAVELSAAMPLSWLPLISDYTREAEKPVKGAIVSVFLYGAVSCWMYIIGMGAAIFMGESDIAQIMIKSGLGLAGLLIIVLSTVTTTFLDAYSAGVSGETLSSKVNKKNMAVVVVIIGVIGAIFLPLYNITNFLYFIGSVFAPMIAIQISDYFILKRNNEKNMFCIDNLIIWFVGFVFYRILMNYDIVIGHALPCIVVIMIISVVVNNIKKNNRIIL